jgi:hypothetical protein
MGAFVLGLKPKTLRSSFTDADLDLAIQDSRFIPMDNVVPLHEDVVEEIQQTFAKSRY